MEEVVAPVVQQVAEVVTPVAQTDRQRGLGCHSASVGDCRPLVEPAAEAVGPVVGPMQEQVAPIVQQVAEVTTPIAPADH